MSAINSPETLARPFLPVKSSPPDPFPDVSHSVIHHKVSLSKKGKMIVSYSTERSKTYGVSESRRVLTPEFLMKRFDYIRDCLEFRLGLTRGERETILRILRFWAYYGNVYVKQSQVSEEPGVSKATYWRAIRRLRDLGLITVVNRYILRPHAQISNLYRLDRLLVVLARYLAEHIAHVWPDWLTPALTMPAQLFWSFLSRAPGDRAGPLIPAF